MAQVPHHQVRLGMPGLVGGLSMGPGAAPEAGTDLGLQVGSPRGWLSPTYAPVPARRGGDRAVARPLGSVVRE